MLHRRLWNQHIDLAQACLDHPFVRGLGSGSLDDSAFKRYVAQDAFFLAAFTRAYALCAAKCDSLDDARVFHSLMGGGFDELRLHATYAKAMDIDLEQVRPYKQTSAYVHFLLHMAWEREVGEIVSALAPCMQLYAFLGQSLKEKPIKNNPYQAWIDTYAGNDFAALVAQLNGLLDRLANDSHRVHDANRYAMQCEFDFFTAPLEAIV
ncbi:TenA family protein [bacterium]|nr:TenA family protein [bacterium]